MASADTLKHFFGVSDYDWSPMNQLRFAALTVRGMLLGGKNASAGASGGVPVKPWMGMPDYGWPFGEEFWKEKVSAVTLCLFCH